MTSLYGFGLVCSLLLTTPPVNALSMEDLSEISWDFLDQSKEWSLIQADAVADSFSDLSALIDYQPKPDPVIESNWMSIIDLIQGCDL